MPAGRSPIRGCAASAFSSCCHASAAITVSDVAIAFSSVRYGRRATIASNHTGLAQTGRISSSAAAGDTASNAATSRRRSGATGSSMTPNLVGRTRGGPRCATIAPMSDTTIVRAERAVTPDGVRAVDVVIRDGIIADVTAPGTSTAVDLPAGRVLLPGLVDSHVHVNEPGRTEWEGFATATRAAAAGGVTTIVDMPLNSIPPTTNVANLAAKQGRRRGPAQRRRRVLGRRGAGQRR